MLALAALSLATAGCSANQYNDAIRDVLLDEIEGQYSHRKGVAYSMRVGPSDLVSLAIEGNAEAQFNLGLAYEKGHPEFGQDVGEARKWYVKAADQGYAKAQSNLGRFYEYGLGGSQDQAEAASWYRRAALQGNVEGQFNLARMLALGKGLPLDLVEAHVWAQRAASQGFADAAELCRRIAQRMTREQLALAFQMANDFSPVREAK